ncbi:MAG: 5-amino-6-(5-phosphoribosylamino)uracil reductase [Candidatus Hadarchaeum yellowstonense]|jgi:2,5-diamino-6-(ribosylamino)-4(3H)-pyrimidinone 5'-phosphate reductase|uniref:2,5-diamino-6-(ribosylamino)-4(3H)-pyrimidinone 5'-phosphate reductase n=1 Tax=Hadarchaeum yellowstonense TaxID=1776334 RepID=A0A147JX05_HADYE|nr:MAG: 5-amino-6-(5-phosphoribosylamino)uracil reductase [Candidatus Hadarchaeum yellowstonense]
MARPYVILNAAMTLDGKIATSSGDSKISSEADLTRLHRLRSRVDAVMVGAGTILADNPSLTVRRVKGKNPIRVVVDGMARIPTDARVLDQSAKTIVAVLKAADEKKVEGLRRAGAEVLLFDGEQINLRSLLEELHRRGIRKLLLEGGSTLNWNMIAAGLVDEIQVTVAPRIVGGAAAKTLVGGAGFPTVKEGVKLRLSKITKVGSDVLLIYRVTGAKRD